MWPKILLATKETAEKGGWEWFWSSSSNFLAVSSRLVVPNKLTITISTFYYANIQTSRLCSRVRDRNGGNEGVEKVWLCVQKCTLFMLAAIFFITRERLYGSSHPFLFEKIVPSYVCVLFLFLPHTHQIIKYNV